MARLNRSSRKRLFCRLSMLAPLAAVITRPLGSFIQDEKPALRRRLARQRSRRREEGSDAITEVSFEEKMGRSGRDQSRFFGRALTDARRSRIATPAFGESGQERLRLYKSAIFQTCAATLSALIRKCIVELVDFDVSTIRTDARGLIRHEVFGVTNYTSTLPYAPGSDNFCSRSIFAYSENCGPIKLNRVVASERSGLRSTLLHDFQPHAVHGEAIGGNHRRAGQCID